MLQPLFEITFNPISDTKNPKQIRIIEIEGITGLTNIESAFENMDNLLEIEALMIFLNKKYDLDSGNYDVFNYIKNVINFSIRTLEAFNMNYDEFYDNMTTDEACFVILNKILGKNDIESKNGFPIAFNFVPEHANKMQKTVENKNWFPYVKGRHSLNSDMLLVSILHYLNTDNSRVMFHGTSWNSALSIMDEINIRPRQRATDFGLRNFYLTDTFSTACSWANRNNQAAIVIFIVPELFIESLQNHLYLIYDQNWKELIFKCRNEPSGLNIRQERRAYQQYIREIDSKDLISGPICCNPGVNNINEIECIKYREYIPYQFSFKDSTCAQLNDFLAVTLFFEEKI